MTARTRTTPRRTSRAKGPSRRDLKLTKRLLRQFYRGTGRRFGARVQGSHNMPWGIKTPMGDHHLYHY